MRKIVTVISVVVALMLALGSTVAIAAPPEKVDVIIGFNRLPGPPEEGLIRSSGGDIKFTYNIIPAIAASVPETAIRGLLKNPKVTVIEPDVTIHAIDIELDNTWGVKHIGAGAVHDSGNKGALVKVAIIDSGIDYTHPDLCDNYAGGYDFVNDDDDPMDDNGHGTHVAGTIAALDNDIGVVGVAPEVEIYALKVLDSDGSGSTASVIAALDWICGELGNPPKAQITNNSYGSTGDPGLFVQLAFDLSYEFWGILHVAASGNTGVASGEGDNVEYPARFGSVMAVAATDQNDFRADFSSTGLAVEIAAPGVLINSTFLGGGYVKGSGTSMASPHVAGTAALVISSGIITDTSGNGFINDEVRQRLIDTAYDLGVIGPDTLYGYGLVDAEAAAIDTSPQIELTPSGQNFVDVQEGQCSSTYSFTLTNLGGGTATGSVSITGSDVDQFEITSGGGGFSLGADESKNIDVRFCPTSIGAKSANLFADGSNCNDDTSSLSGNGVPSPTFTIEVGELSLNHNWQMVNLTKSFIDPVVVAKPLSSNGWQPAVVRIRNVTPTSFEIRIQEWEYLDGSHNTEQVSWLALERGHWTLPNGAEVEAGTIDTNSCGTSSFAVVNFSSTFSSTPVVISSVMTSNDNETVATRNRNVTTAGFEVTMQEQELNAQSHATETISYIVWEPGSGTVDTMNYEVALGGNVKNKWVTINYGPLASSPYLLADMQTTNGGDPANLRYRNKTNNSVEIRVAEEQSKDTETDHISESIGYFAFN